MSYRVDTLHLIQSMIPGKLQPKPGIFPKMICEVDSFAVFPRAV